MSVSAVSTTGPRLGRSGVRGGRAAALLTLSVCFLILSPALRAEDFFSPSNQFLSLDDPIRVGMDAFEARVGAARAQRAEGEPLGLVLSGGSARAFAHVGVLEALEEEGIKPDFLVANSMGAVVALLYASGMAPKDIELLIESYPVTELFDAAAPTRGGFLDARRFASMMRELIAWDDIADFPIPLLIICEDLQSRRQVWLASGEVGAIACASFALPAIFDPILMDGMRLIDGGVTNLVPVGAAAQYTDAVIAATSLYSREIDLSNPLVILNRALDLGKSRTAITELDRFRPAVIRCAVEDVSYMAFDGVATIVRRGYESAREAMPQVLAKVASRSSSGEESNERLEKARTLHHQRVLALIAERALGTTYPLSPGALSWAPVLRIADAAGGFGDASRAQILAGARATWSSGLYSANVSAYARLDDGSASAGGSAMAGDTGLSAGFSWRPLGVAKLDAQASLALDSSSLVSDPATAARSLILQATAATSFSGPFGLVYSPLLRGEVPFSLSSETSAPPALAESGLILASAPGGPSADVGLSYSLYLAAFADGEGNLGPSWATTLQAPLIGTLGLRLRGSGRFSLSGEGSSYRSGDGYRGPGGGVSGWDTESSAFGSAVFGPAILRGVANLGLDWDARFLRLDFAEAFLIRRLSASPFLDLAYAGSRLASPSEYSVRYAAGVSMELSLSVFGLSPIDLSFYVSRDLEDEIWSWGLLSGFLFENLKP